MKLTDEEKKWLESFRTQKFKHFEKCSSTREAFIEGFIAGEATLARMVKEKIE